MGNQLISKNTLFSTMTLEDVARARIVWFQDLSPEDQAKVQQAREEFKAEETKAERLQEVAATFGAADANQDGVLDKAEFTDFMGKLGQNAAARGVPHMSVDGVSDDVKEAVWAVFNGQTEGTDGVSMADFGAVSELIGAKIREMSQ